MISPTFSIITVCLNEAGSIRATCDSICAQSFRDFEWIVIDGGSTDGTLKILEDYEETINFLMSESDHGIYDAMNKGLRRAEGEYVIFMNAGDCFAGLDVLARVSAFFGSDMLVGNLFLNENGQVYKSPDHISKNYLLQNMLPHQSAFFKRSLFDKFGHFDTSYHIAGDYEMFARLLQSNEISYRHIPETIAVFEAGGISANVKHRSLRKQENHRIRWRYFPAYRHSFKALRQQLRNIFK
jgi:glycosyltransferase involved in cell wall biosynthesis